MMNVGPLVPLLILILCCGASAPAAEKRETIRGDTLYFPTQDEADAVKKLWDEPVRKQYSFAVGSADANDYVAAKPITSPQPSAGKLRGKVLALALVDRHGEVVAMQVVESTDHRLELPTLDTLRRWKFEPARYKKKTVMTAVAVPFEFGK